MLADLHLLLQEQALYIAEGSQTTLRPLVANTRLLVATKWSTWVDLQVSVNPD